MKKILSIVLLFVFLISLCSCETNPNELLKETEEQATEQTSVPSTESTQETRPQYVINHISISENGELRLEYRDSSSKITSYILTNVKKCMFRVKDSRSQATTTLDRKKPMGYASDTYYDFIYVVFEKGHRIPDRHKEIIEKYGIQYGFE